MKEVFKEIFAQITIKDAITMGLIFLVMISGIIGTLFLCR